MTREDALEMLFYIEEKTKYNSDIPPSYFKTIRASLQAQINPLQPIATAPKDGSWIIVVSGKNIIGDADTPYLARWVDNWGSFRNGLNNDTKPTHWMPLPLPPEETKNA